MFVFELTDDSGKIECELFGSYVNNLQKLMGKSTDGMPDVVFQFAKIKIFQGLLSSNRVRLLLLLQILGWNLLISLLALISQRAMSGQGRVHSVENVYVALEVVKTLMNKQSLLLAFTHDQDVFNFYSEERSCNGFLKLIKMYFSIWSLVLC